jgi:hypothetical protein
MLLDSNYTLSARIRLFAHQTWVSDRQSLFAARTVRLGRCVFVNTILFSGEHYGKGLPADETGRQSEPDTLRPTTLGLHLAR